MYVDSTAGHVTDKRSTGTEISVQTIRSKYILNNPDLIHSLS